MKTAFCLLMLLFSGIPVVAQEKLIGQAEFDSATKIPAGDAVGNFKNRPHRITNILRTKVEGPVSHETFLTAIFERDGQGNLRNTSEGISNGKSNKISTILIGGELYTRRGDGEWSKRTYSDTPAPEPAPAKTPDFEIVESDVKYMDMGVHDFRNQKVRVYLKSQKGTSVLKANGAVSNKEITQTFWVAADGTVLKKEWKSVQDTGQSVSRITTIYELELDPAITITAPPIEP